MRYCDMTEAELRPKRCSLRMAWMYTPELRARFYDADAYLRHVLGRRAAEPETATRTTTWEYR